MLNYRALYIIAGLLLCRTCAGTSEGKSYSQKLIKMDELGKNDQVIVQRSGTNEIAGQYFCVDGICTISSCVNCFKNQSGYLVLYNSSNLYRYDAYLNGINLMYLNGSPLQNFTLVEDVSSTSTTTAVPDETHIPSVTQNDVSSTSTTTAVPDETNIPSVTQNEPFHTTKIPEDTGEALSMSTEAKVLMAVGIIGAIALVAALVFTIARRAGRDAITEAFRSLQRKICNREPNQQVENPGEMNPFMPNPNEV